ncbi:MAG: chemotaxis response regulator protein-glutamate methylesterase [Candidatus Acidiferrales bacterium]
MTESKDRLRVLIVEDSGFMRKVLHDIISADPQMEVVGEARDGREGVALAQALKPDVITMDINMPHLDGLQATELIMSQNPRPIVIVSSESREGASETLRALELGAVDFVPKPSSGIDLDMHRVGQELSRKLKTAAKVRVVRTATLSRIGQPAGKPLAASGSASSILPTAAASSPRFPCIVVAASTGGPATVLSMIPRLPKDLPAAVVLVQHMPAAFTSQFTVQLADASRLRVKEAAASEVIQPGIVYVCPGSHHLRFAGGGRITLDGGDRISGYRPCADVALETAADYLGPMTVGVILTGMGNDGAKGVKAVKLAGGYVIAQDEATSVIFGMPAEAIKTGVVDEILAIDDIAAAIERRTMQLCRVTPVNAR